MQNPTILHLKCIALNVTNLNRCVIITTTLENVIKKILLRYGLCNTGLTSHAIFK